MLSGCIETSVDVTGVSLELSSVVISSDPVFPSSFVSEVEFSVDCSEEFSVESKSDSSVLMSFSVEIRLSSSSSLSSSSVDTEAVFFAASPPLPLFAL